MSLNKQQFPKILYIMGTARSGTTLLETILSQPTNTFGAGEMTRLVSDGWKDNRLCSCGRSFYSCPVWGEVAKKMDLNISEIYQWSSIQRKIEWHLGFLWQLTEQVPSYLIKTYKQYNSLLLKTLKDVTGAPVIVDSSKYAGRALALKRYLDVDLIIICMTRDPLGMLVSFQKKGIEHRSKSPLSAFVYYIVITSYLKLTCSLLSVPIIKLTLQDFLNDPIKILNQIEKITLLDYSDVKIKIQKGEKFPVGHQVTGNRLLKQGFVRIDPKKAYIEKVDKTTIAMAKLMSLWRHIIKL